MGEARFVRRFGDGNASTADEARRVFRRAADRHAATAILAAELRSNGVAVPAAMTTPAMSATLEAVSRDNPNLATLFQLVDLCECEDCRSVTSPAAYLVDVLEFIKQREVIDKTLPSPAPSTGAQEILFKRRPDLWEIDLSCDNTNVPVPYIDLVNELLEEVVSPTTGFTFNGAIAPGKIPPALLTALQGQHWPFTATTVVQPRAENVTPKEAFSVRDDGAVARLTKTATDVWNVRRLRQTFQSAAEVAAAPEYVNDDAYIILAASKIAFHLPFDLPLSESRGYFAQFDIARSDLMRALAIATGPSDAEIAAEALGLSNVEHGLVVSQTDAANQAVYWNTTPDKLAIVDELLKRTELSYPQLQELLDLGFINRGDTLFIRHDDSSCDTTKKEVVGLDDDALDRIHRFLRLWRKLDWPMETLDQAIAAERLGKGFLRDDLVIGVAGVEALRARLGVSREDLIIFYGLIPTSGSPSRYAQLFLNAAANGFVDPALTVDAVAANEAGGTVKLDAVASTLTLAFGLNADDLALLVASLADDKLTFAHLAALYAKATLARALGRSVAELVALEQLSGIDPLQSAADTMRFADESDRLRAASMSPADLHFLLTYQADDLPRRVMAAPAIVALLTAIQTQLQAAFEEDRSPFDATLTAEENKLAVLRVVGRLPGIADKDLSGLQSIIDDTYAGPPVAQFLAQALSPFLDSTTLTALTALAQQIPTAADIEKAKLLFIEALLSAVSAYLFAQARDAIVAAAVAAAYRLPDPMAAVLVHDAELGGTALYQVLGSDALIDQAGQPPVPPAITEAAFPAQFSAARLLHQIALLVGALGLSPQTTSWLLVNAAALGWLQLDELPHDTGALPRPLSEWNELFDGVALLARFGPVDNPTDPTQPLSFLSVLTKVLTAGTAASDLLDWLAIVTGWDRAVLGDLHARFGFTVDDYRHPATYARLEKAVTLLRRLGLGVGDAANVAQPAITADEAKSLRTALKARYEPTQWLDLLKTIQDPLRENKRDALVAYILANDPSLRDTDDLFDYFLLDVEMGACMMTSRIVAAHGSVQLFAQRCLLGIEPQAVADQEVDSGWSQWTWMRNYRVWEANRKVFLYPEDWIEPTLRDDKSEQFEALENALQQNDLTDFNIEAATIDYLESVDEIAFLEVRAMYYDEVAYELHVFARTKGGDPPTYYHRRFQQERAWTPWEKVDLDITGDHLLAFMHSGRLHLAWPIFTEETNPDQKIDIPPPPTTPQPAEKPEKVLRIQLAISQYGNGRWQPKKTSQDSLTFGPRVILPPRLGFRFTYVPFQSVSALFPTANIRDFIFCTVQDDGLEVLGRFDLAGCRGYPEALQNNSYVTVAFEPIFDRAQFLGQRWIEALPDMPRADQLAIWTLFGGHFVELLGNTPGTFRVTTAEEMTTLDIALLLFTVAAVSTVGRKPIYPTGTFLPYFFEDGAHNYVVIPGFFGSGPIDETPNPPPPERRTFTDVFKLFQAGWWLLWKYVAMQQPPYNWPQIFQQILADPAWPPIAAGLAELKDLTYFVEFKNFYHPLMCALRKTLYSDGIPALMNRQTQLQQSPFKFGDKTTYDPQAIVRFPYPVEDIDFDEDGSYASYNWELFFHLPFEIAVRLTNDQRFEEAARWFHYIFDPTDASTGTVPQKYWRTKPFFLRMTDEYKKERIDSIITGVDAEGSVSDPLHVAIANWRKQPFAPYVVARSRTVALQKAVLMKYIDNLVAWGDSLFRQDTMESVTQATQMYILADKLLGPKPRSVPPAVDPLPECYDQLEKKIDAFSDALLDLEEMVPDLDVLPHHGAELPPPPNPPLTGLYFCIPPNEKMLAQWDTVGDRLFKIRHCQNIDGVERQLALFAPPIDPGVLVAAAAAGLDLGAVIAGLNAPPPIYRFGTMVQKASELTQIVVSLGNAMAQALEKRDAEALARLHSSEELRVLDAVKAVKQQQIEEAKAQIVAITRSIEVAQERVNYYRSREFMNASETLAMGLNTTAVLTQLAALGLDAAAGVASLVPSFNIGLDGFGGSPEATLSWGGSNIAGAASGFSGVVKDIAAMMQGGAAIAATIASYQRRQDEWNFQATLADKEIVQLQQQQAAAQIRQTIAEKDLAAHEAQIESAKKTDAFLHGKFTNQELYDYVIGQLSGIYFRGYQLALDVARKAERCFRHELGGTATFIKGSYWDNLQKGLTAGDRLLGDIKQLDVAYLDQNRREYELTKEVSLAQLDPLALMQLQGAGSCVFSLPEALFDLDHPGHYMRRIKSIALSVPCVTGPYTSVSCKLSLTANRYRKDPIAGPETPNNDSHFIYNVGTIQSIATSHAQQDGGLFELNFRDERYLPFEGTGAISSWRLEMPAKFPPFDYQTIADVVLHVRYTARDGGSKFRGDVETALATALNDMLADTKTKGLFQLVSLRQERPNEWAQLGKTGATPVTVSAGDLPYFTTAHAPKPQATTWVARADGTAASLTIKVDGTDVTLTKQKAYGGLYVGPAPTPIALGSAFTLEATNAAKLRDLALIVGYSVAP
jgi:hypothetical protein